MPLSIRFRTDDLKVEKVNGRGTDSADIPEWPKWAKML